MLVRFSWPCLTAVLLSVLLVGGARADQWLPPEVREYLSVDEAWRLTVTPYDALDANGSAKGVMEHRERGQWRRVWSESLLNEVAPVQVLVSSSGQVVTFDNWYSTGHGDNVVVIYDRRGRAVRSLELADFLPDEYVETLSHSVSSIRWGGEHHLAENEAQVVLQVAIPSVNFEERDRYVPLAFDLATGRAIAPSNEAWAEALQGMQEVIAIRQQHQAEFEAPLLGPRNDDESEWLEYLREAFYRLDPDWQETSPHTAFVTPGQLEQRPMPVYDPSAEISSETAEHQVLMIASSSQDYLARALSKLTAGVPRGVFTKARIYIVADDAHTRVFENALAHTGALYIRLDPNKPIPQRQERIEAFFGRGR